MKPNFTCLDGCELDDSEFSSWPTEELYPAIVEADTLYHDGIKSIALVTINGTNRAVRNMGSNTTYEVKSGKGSFTFPEKGKTRDVGQGDIVPIPTGRAYQDSGNLVMLVTSIPPFKSEYEKPYQAHS